MDITLNYIFYPHENTYNNDKKMQVSKYIHVYNNGR